MLYRHHCIIVNDLNFDPVIFPGETSAAAAFSGVFQYEVDCMGKSGICYRGFVFADTAFSQLLNGYTCPVMTVFDSIEQNYYATFLAASVSIIIISPTIRLKKIQWPFCKRYFYHNKICRRHYRTDPSTHPVRLRIWVPMLFFE